MSNFNSISGPSNFIKSYYIDTILMYLLSAIVLYCFLFKIGAITAFPNKYNLVTWDAGFYHSIKNGGYQYYTDRVSNIGFFPLFPYFWKLTHL